jgi:hypothetical protein
MAANSSGAKRLRGPTVAQQSVQSLQEPPSPMETDMLTAAIAATAFSDFAGSFAQQLSHLNLSAKLKNLRSRTPSPPKSVGRQTTG